MAFLVMNKIKTRIMQGQLDFRDAGADHRLILVMTNTTTDTEDDVEFVGSYTTLDEYDGGSRPPAFGSRDAPNTPVVTEDLPGNAAYLDAGDEVLTSVSAGTRANQGILIYEHITNDAASRGIVYIDASFTGNGGNVTLQFNASGILSLGV